MTCFDLNSIVSSYGPVVLTNNLRSSFGCESNRSEESLWRKERCFCYYVSVECRCLWNRLKMLASLTIFVYWWIKRDNRSVVISWRELIRRQVGLWHTSESEIIGRYERLLYEFETCFLVIYYIETNRILYSPSQNKLSGEKFQFYLFNLSLFLKQYLSTRSR